MGFRRCLSVGLKWRMSGVHTIVTVRFRHLDFACDDLGDIESVFRPVWTSDPVTFRFDDPSIEQTTLEQVGIAALAKSLVPLTPLFDLYLADLDGVLLPNVDATVGELCFSPLSLGSHVSDLTPALLAAPGEVGPCPDGLRSAPWCYKLPRRAETAKLAPIVLVLMPKPTADVASRCDMMQLLKRVHAEQYAATRRDYVSQRKAQREAVSVIAEVRDAKASAILSTRKEAERRRVQQLRLL